MTTLTSEQKNTGRRFRDEWHERLRALPPVKARCLPYHVWYRHECPGRGSQALRLRQHYARCDVFVFYWREGTCLRCELSVRSSGSLELYSDDFPEKGSVEHVAD